jgi:hypothetical protein
MNTRRQGVLLAVRRSIHNPNFTTLVNLADPVKHRKVLLKESSDRSNKDDTSNEPT